MYGVAAGLRMSFRVVGAMCVGHARRGWHWCLGGVAQKVEFCRYNGGMSERSINARMAVLLAVMFVLLMILCFRLLIYPETDSTIAWQPGMVMSADQAGAIAIAEFKKREGWSGIINDSSSEGAHWFVTIRRNAGETADWRQLTVSAEDGRIEDYEGRTLSPAP